MRVERVVVTDTASSATPEEAAREGVVLLPLHMVWPDKTQDTDLSVPADTFYRKMKEQGIPSTSGGTHHDFLQLYRSLYQKGAREIISVLLTGLKSITCSSAITAARDLKPECPGLTVEVIDSENISLPQWFLVQVAAEMARNQASLASIRQEVTRLVHSVRLYIAIGTLDNLIKSGRVGGVQALVASALKLLPVIQIERGDPRIIGRVRSARMGRKAVADRIRKDVEQMGLPAKLGLVYTQDVDVALELKEELSDLWRGGGIALTEPKEAGPILGIHSGPGTAAVAALWR